MKKKISIIVTAYKEPQTVSGLIGEICRQVRVLKETYDFEVLLVCPDQETKVAGLGKDTIGIISWIKDYGRGKPAALSLAFKKATGRVLVLTDGDVSWDKNVLGCLLPIFEDLSVGLATGRPIPVNSRDNLFGFWAHLLTDIGAHYERAQRSRRGLFIDGSGYLMAIRSGLVKKVPTKVLSDDAYISRKIFSQGKKTIYQPKAKVYVKFPTNFSDWLKQKKRSAGGYVQLGQMEKRDQKETMRSFSKELSALKRVFSYPETTKEYFWLLLLLISRVYLWLVVFWERKILPEPDFKPWPRIESTK